MYERELIKAGLDEKQAKVYLACLELGLSKTPEIARKSGIKRTTAYGILDELLALGVVSVSVKGKTKRFQAQDPKVFEELLNERKKQVEKILPGLTELFTTHSHRPRMQFFEGTEGVKRIFEDTLACRSKKIYQIVKVKEWIEVLGRMYTTNYVQRRVDSGIETFALHPKSGDVYDEPYATESKTFKRQSRYLPPSIFYASMITIYDNKVAMASTKKENFGFIIESHEFARTLEAYFHFMWGLGSKEPE